MLGLIALQSVLLAVQLLPSQGQDVPLQVTGVIRLNVDLSPPVNQTCSVSRVYWQFQNDIMASFYNRFFIENNQFENRLEMLQDGRTLRISHLRMEDSGLYSVHITCTDGKKYRTSYNVTVFEPVPPPAIRIGWKKRTSDWCNMTIHCSVPTNTSALSYTWRNRHNNSEYQPYGNGDTTQVSLTPESWDMELLCVVHNPVDEKNAYLRLQKICCDLGERNLQKIGKQRSHYAVLALLLILPVLLIGWLMFKKKKRKRKKEPIGGPLDEIHYADLMLGSQSQVPDSGRARSNSSQNASHTTIYSVLRHGPATEGADVPSTQHVHA